MPRARKRPVEIEYVQFTGDNEAEVAAFTNGDFRLISEGTRDDGDPAIIAEVLDMLHSTWVGVKLNDFIIKGLKGEFYPHDAELFWVVYEPVED